MPEQLCLLHFSNSKIRCRKLALNVSNETNQTEWGNKNCQRRRSLPESCANIIPSPEGKSFPHQNKKHSFPSITQAAARKDKQGQHQVSPSWTEGKWDRKELIVLQQWGEGGGGNGAMQALAAECVLGASSPCVAKGIFSYGWARGE